MLHCGKPINSFVIFFLHWHRISYRCASIITARSNTEWLIYHLFSWCRTPKHKYKSITPDDVAAKATSASQDMSHDSASQAMSQDVSDGDEDTANKADAVPAITPAPAVAADTTLAPSQARRWKGVLGIIFFCAWPGASRRRASRVQNAQLSGGSAQRGLSRIRISRDTLGYRISYWHMPR